MKFLGTTQKIEKQEHLYYTTIDTNPIIQTESLLGLKDNYTYKKYTHVRISEIANFCPREYAIGYLFNITKKAKTGYSLMQQFEIGSALHFWYQNFSPVFKDKLCGYWKCWGCGNIITKKGNKFFGTRDNLPKKCEYCGSSTKASFYEEFYFRVDEPYRVVGKIDGFLKNGSKYYILDLKTFFNKEDFPKKQDKIQISSYLIFYETLPSNLKVPVDVDTEKCYLFYISKKFSHKESILTYEVKRENKIVEPILKNIKLFTDCVKMRKLPPPFDLCVRSNWSKGKAKNCYVKDLCKERL